MSMKHYLPEISWHALNAVYSADFQCNSEGKYRIVTAGLEKDIRIWELKFDEKYEVLEVDFIANLREHQARGVNVVRFSPDGSMLASGDLEGALLVWKKSESTAPDIFANDDLPPNKETWIVQKRLRGHQNDVCDLCWSPDGERLASVSTDESVIVFAVQTGVHLVIQTDHKRFPNGVCWDPRDRFFATMGVDRELHVYSSQPPKYKRLNRIRKAKLSTDESVKLFHDESMPSFTRRLTFTPDGEFLIAPAGCIEKGDETLNATFVFSRQGFEKPCLMLEGSKKSTVAVKCCPIFFELRNNEANLFGLPYRIVFAVLARQSVILYDSQHASAIAYSEDIHYASLTDLTWSSDGRLLFITSEDGYCSLFRFPEQYLGVPLSEIPERPPSPVPVPQTKTPKSVKRAPKVELNESTPSSDAKSKTPHRKIKSPGAGILGWIQKSSKKTTPTGISSFDSSDCVAKDKTPTATENVIAPSRASSVVPRRVPFETVSCVSAVTDSDEKQSETNDQPMDVDMEVAKIQDSQKPTRRVAFITLD